jgi:hypothetical protein
MSGVKLGEWFEAEKVCPPLSDRDHSITLLSIVSAHRRPNGEHLKKQTKKEGIDG